LQALVDVAEGGGPVGRAEVAVAVEAELRVGQAVGGGEGLVEQGALGADAAEVGGRVLHAADAVGPAARALQAQAAAHPAVGTDRLPQGGRPAVGGHRGSPIASCVTTPVVGAAVPWSGAARPPSAPELTRGDCRGYLAS